MLHIANDNRKSTMKMSVSYFDTSSSVEANKEYYQIQKTCERWCPKHLTVLKKFKKSTCQKHADRIELTCT